MVRGRGRFALLSGALVVLCAGLPPGAAHSVETDGYVKSGAWELGFNGAIISREGAVTTTLWLFTNRFWVRGTVPLSAGASVAYSRVSDLDRVDLEGLAAVYKQLTESSAYVYIGVAGGLSQEWVGSFSQARYPFGLDAGIKAFVSRRAAVTVTYQFRRFFNDPVADFNENRFVAGLSIMLNNGRDDPR
jgi:hypothetical protein